MILGDELGIGHDPGQHAAYVGSWIKTLKDDPMEYFGRRQMPRRFRIM